MLDFDKIFIIILKDRQKQFAKNCISQLLEHNIDITKVEFVDAVNGRTTSQYYNSFEGWEIPGHSNSWWNRPVTPGEVGCALSHYNIWRKVQSERYENVLVLEEDFKIYDNFEIYHFNNKITDYDLFYYGRNKVNKNKKEIIVDSKVVIPDYSYCTHAYALSYDGAYTLAESGFQHNIIPVDEFLNLWFIEDHPRQELYGLIKKKKDFKAYSFHESIIGQTSDGQTRI